MRPRLPLRFSVFVVVFFAFTWVSELPAMAQPSVPATFYGTVAVDGAAPPDGTPVRGFVGANDCTQDDDPASSTLFVDGVAQYSVTIVHESQRPGCGAEGREVTFTIGGEPARQSARWIAGTQQLNLSAGAGEPPELPATTPPPLSSPSVPPTDDITPPVFGATVPTDSGRSANTGDRSLLPWVLAVTALAIALGAILGMTISRRRGTGL